MISPELLRRYPHFAGLSSDQLVTLARAAQEESVAAGEFVFHEGDALDRIYIVIEGEAAVLVDLPGKSREVILSTVGPGEVFAWSGLVPPHQATSSVRAMTPCRVMAFDCKQLLAEFDEDYALGYLMMQRLAQVMRDRIQDMHMETISCMAE
jgi:CRP/FNR family transcriptional regulator, cyclic AMP receptor protein